MIPHVIIKPGKLRTPFCRGTCEACGCEWATPSAHFRQRDRMPCPACGDICDMSYETRSWRTPLERELDERRSPSGMPIEQRHPEYNGQHIQPCWWADLVERMRHHMADPVIDEGEEVDLPTMQIMQNEAARVLADFAYDTFHSGGD